MVLKNLPGVGQNLATKLTTHFGSEEKVISLLEEGRSEVIAEVDGVSLKRAEKLSRNLNGIDSFLATPESKRLHKEIVNLISKYANNKCTKNRIKAVMPVNDISKRQKIISDAMLCDYKIENLANPVEPDEYYERVIVSKKPLDILNRYCRILIPSEQETWKDYKVFKSVTWIGEDGPEKTPDNWIVLPEKSPTESALPELIISWFEANLSSLELISNLPKGKGFLKYFDEIRIEGLELLLKELSNNNEIDEIIKIKDQLWPLAKSLESKIHSEVDEAMKNVKLDISGSDMLEALADAAVLQRRLSQQTSDSIEQAIETATDELSEFLSTVGIRCPRNIFKAEWPTKVDRTVLDSIDKELELLQKNTENTRTISLARRLSPIKQKCEKSIRKLVELDQWLTIGRWANDSNAIIPEICKDGFSIIEGRNLLLGDSAVPVSYGLGNCASEGDKQSIALLTGANSGGKTTLLELIGQFTILAHMGLPVPAKKAKIGEIQALHVLAKARGTQSAGALEQTLLQLAEIVSDESSKLILADELEAITEPGAGARIISAMLETAEKHQNTTMLLVTHLAPAIIEAAGYELRTDGIEARGLDENLELIVDRNPRRNYLARSTPELIVRRLVQRSNGSAKDVFNSILERF